MDILKTYATQFRGQSVRLDNFQQVAEQVYGQSLNWFFQEWIYQRVSPSPYHRPVLRDSSGSS